MRKTNNREGSGSEQNEGVFWVVSDADTGEHLVAYDLYGSEVWKDILIEEGVDGGIADIEPSARFESEEDARVAAQSLADKIAEEHPDDPVYLLISKLSVETVEMVIALETTCDVERKPSRVEASDEDDHDDADADAESDEGALAPEDDWFVGSRARGGSGGWSALNEDPEPKKSKKVKGSKKEKKSTRES